MLLSLVVLLSLGGFVGPELPTSSLHENFLLH